MAMVVKNNMSAVTTLNTLNKNSSTLQRSLQKVSSGLKIVSAQDDASGYAISERMRVRIRSLDQATQNSQNGSSLMKTAEGALSSTIEILKTLKEKAINAATDTNTDEDRATIQKEVNQFVDQIDDNALVTFNGKYLLEGSKSQSGIETYTTMTNESLAIDTMGNDEIISLKNRKGESLEINSTDKLTASYVKDGVTYTTSYRINHSTLNDIFANLNELAGGTVFGNSRIVSSADAENPIYSNSNLASNTIMSASLSDLRAAFNAEPKADFELELAAMNEDIATSSLITDVAKPADDQTVNSYTALRNAFLDSLLEMASETGMTETGTDGSLITRSTGFLQITHLDGSVEKIALYNTDGSALYEETPETDDDGNPVTDSDGNVSSTTEHFTHESDVIPDSFQTAADAIMDYIDEKLKDILANGTETTITSETMKSILEEGVVLNTGGRDNVTGVETSTTGEATISSIDTTAGVYSQVFTVPTEESEPDDDGNTTMEPTGAPAPYEYLRSKIEAIFVENFNGLVMANDDVGLVAGDKVTKTIDGEKGVTVTASSGGLYGQIAGLTINVTDSEGQNRKSVNEFLNAFKTTIYAANESSDHSLNIHVGAEANLSIALGMADMRSEALGLKGSDGSVISLATLDAANAAISVFENALQKALDQQTTIGAALARLEYTASNLTVSSENVQAAESVIRDADMAKEMTEYTKSNVLLQAAQSMLAQANQNSSAVLSLLQ